MNPQQLKKIIEIGLVGLVIALILGALPALGFVSLDTGYVLLGAAFFVCMVLIWTDLLKGIFPDFSTVKKSISTVIVLAIFAALGFVGRQKVRADEQLDTRNHLEFKAALPSFNDLNSTTITVTNGGHLDIHYRLICHVTLLVANNGGTVIEESGFRNHERAGTLDAGLDAQSDDCLSGMLVPIKILDCADIKIRFFYSLGSQPDIQEEKDHGFVARKRGDQFEWEDRSAEQKVSDCQKFVRTRPPTLDDSETSTADAIKAQNDAILSTHSPILAKQFAAILSNEIFRFGVDQEPNMPKSGDIEKDGFQGVMRNQQQFLAWGRDSSHEFHSLFDARLQKTFRSAQEAGINVENVRGDCSIISESYPPTLRMTRRCGIGVGEIAAKLPAR